MTTENYVVLTLTLLAVTLFCIAVLGVIKAIHAIRSSVHLRPVTEPTDDDIPWLTQEGIMLLDYGSTAPPLECDCCGKELQYHDEVPVRVCCMEGQRLDLGLHEQGEDIRPILFKAAEPPKQVASVGNTGAVRVRPTAERA